MARGGRSNSDFQHKVNTGSLFKNDYKERDSHPDLRGKAMIQSPDGETFEVEISGWWNEGRKSDYLSITIKEPYEKGRGDRDRGSDRSNDRDSRGRGGDDRGDRGRSGSSGRGGRDDRWGSRGGDRGRDGGGDRGSRGRQERDPERNDDFEDDDIPF